MIYDDDDFVMIYDDLAMIYDDFGDDGDDFMMVLAMIYNLLHDDSMTTSMMTDDGHYYLLLSAYLTATAYDDSTFGLRRFHLTLATI
jgi:hypothetical protein